jgi:hypothetical protein
VLSLNFGEHAMQNDRSRRAFAEALALLASGSMLSGVLAVPSQGPTTKVCARPKGGAPSPSPRPVHILFDRTTHVPEEARTSCVRAVVELVSRVGAKTFVSLFGGDGPTLIEAIFEGTVPAALSDRELANRRFSLTPAQVKADDVCRAAMPAMLTNALVRGLRTQSGPGGVSPILAAISAVCAQAGAEAAPLSIVFSDGIEHTPPLRTFYGRAPDSLRLPVAEDLIDQLKKSGELPHADGADIFHLAFGLTAPRRDGTRSLRAMNEVAALKAIWNQIYRAAGARSWVFGEPLPPGGLMLASAVQVSTRR